MELPPPGTELHRLMTRFPRAGEVRWIGLRPARDVPMREVDSVVATVGGGLAGDRYAGGSGKRGVTLIQAEHLPVIASLSGHAAIAPAIPPAVTTGTIRFAESISRSSCVTSDTM